MALELGFQPYQGSHANKRHSWLAMEATSSKKSITSSHKSGSNWRNVVKTPTDEVQAPMIDFQLWTELLRAVTLSH